MVNAGAKEISRWLEIWVDGLMMALLTLRSAVWQGSGCSGLAWKGRRNFETDVRNYLSQDHVFFPQTLSYSEYGRKKGVVEADLFCSLESHVP